MITFLTGPIDSGKTSWLAKHYAKHAQGDGFLARKIYRGTKVYGYEAIRLTTKETLPWLIRDDFYFDEFGDEARVGPFHANLQTLAQIEAAYETMMTQKVQPIYLDEIGPWELSGQGFDAIFRKLLAAKGDLFVAIRKDLLNAVVDYYGLQDYIVVQVRK